MSCGSCGTGSSVGGCNNNGHCATGGCNKLNVFDWLSNMERTAGEMFNVMEVRFKNGRKEYFKNEEGLEVVTGDPVVVDVPSGHHIGYVSLQGELVRLQLKKKKVPETDIRGIYRLASNKDLEKFEKLREKEQGMMYKSREIIHELKLEMKLTDVEYQADSTKATFYYSADDRVDFRELIRRLAGEFHIRVEMRQISARQEAGRIGGIGSCGRELCCSTWLSDFKSVNTSAARYQNLSLNPAKLSGQCGRLKCCLNYELETYKDALSDIPNVEKALLTEKGPAYLQKTDIFRKVMWFGYEGDHNWHVLDVSRVAAIIEMNKKGKKPATLAEDALHDEIVDAALNADLEAMDRKFNKGKKKKKKKKKNRNRGPQNQNPTSNDK